MTTNLLIYSQTLRTSLASITDRLQTRLDGLLRAEGIPEEQPQKEGLPAWAIALIVVGVLICLIPLCAVIVIAVLTLMGPSIGNTFSNIVLDI